MRLYHGTETDAYAKIRRHGFWKNRSVYATTDIREAISASQYWRNKTPVVLELNVPESRIMEGPMEDIRHYLVRPLVEDIVRTLYKSDWPKPLYAL